MDSFGETARRLNEVLVQQGRRPVAGAEAYETAAAERLAGVTFPDQLKEWLACFRGAEFDDGWMVIGVDPLHGISIGRMMKDLSWSALAPVASDGAGNLYCLFLDSIRIGHIGFVECTSRESSFIVATSMGAFWRLFAEALHDSGDIFYDRERATKIDPGLREIDDQDLPWSKR